MSPCWRRSPPVAAPAATRSTRCRASARPAAPRRRAHLRRRCPAHVARDNRRRGPGAMDPRPGPARPKELLHMTSKFSPPDASLAPRYTGPRTFARLPHVSLPLDGVDVGVIGVPFDTATSYRTGTRFGPEAIRAVSATLRPYHPA